MVLYKKKPLCGRGARVYSSPRSSVTSGFLAFGFTIHTIFDSIFFSPPRAPQPLSLPPETQRITRPTRTPVMGLRLDAAAALPRGGCRLAASHAPLRPHAAARILYWPPATSSLPSSTIRPRKRCNSCAVKSECVGTHAVASTQVGCAYGCAVDCMG